MSTERSIVVAAEAGIAIHSVKDIPDALGAFAGADGLLLTEAELGQAFFDLKSGLAGELLQKFVNYKMRVAIIVPRPEAYGLRFRELAYEHRTHPLVRFVSSREEADAWLGSA